MDDSVIDRVGKRLRCTWSWYSGRWKKVVKGQNLLGIILTINGKPLPIHLLFFRHSSTRAFYLMDFSLHPLRSSELWRIWKAHNLIEQFWKILK